MAKIRAWERMEQESLEAFEAFRMYRDMPVKRSGQRVADAIGCSTQNVYKWSSKNRWKKRCLAYDRHLDAVFVRTRDQAIVKMKRRQIGTMLAAQELVIDQVEKHLTAAHKFKEAVIPIQHLAKLAAISHTDERTNMEVPESVIRVENGAVDLDAYSADELKLLQTLLKKGRDLKQTGYEGDLTEDDLEEIED